LDQFRTWIGLCRRRLCRLGCGVASADTAACHDGTGSPHIRNRRLFYRAFRPAPIAELGPDRAAAGDDRHQLRTRPACDDRVLADAAPVAEPIVRLATADR